MAAQVVARAREDIGASRLHTVLERVTEEISFTAGGVQYTGYVIGNLIEGITSAAGKSGTWTATK